MFLLTLLSFQHENLLVIYLLVSRMDTFCLEIMETLSRSVTSILCFEIILHKIF